MTRTRVSGIIQLAYHLGFIMHPEGTQIEDSPQSERPGDLPVRESETPEFFSTIIGPSDPPAGTNRHFKEGSALDRAIQMRVPWLAVLRFIIAIASIRIALFAYTLQNRTFPAINAGATWYAVAALLLILALWNSETDASLVTRGTGPRWIVRFKSQPLAWGAIAGGVALNTFALVSLYRSNFFSTDAGLLWLLSVAVLLAVPFWILPVRSDAGKAQAAGFGWTPFRRSELIVLGIILVLSLALRLWRLTDMAPGVFGDEGVVGIDAQGILHGNLPSPFRGGWASQSYVYPYTIALFLKILGPNLAGLRAFAVICGLITVLFTYLLTREMFGTRVAAIAGFLISFQSIALVYSRQQVSNDTLPAFVAGTAYLFVRGERTSKLSDYALSGLVGGSAVYYYAGGRSVILILLVFIAFLSLRNRAYLRVHGLEVGTFLLCAWGIASPFLAYSYLATAAASTTYPNNRFIWLHHAELTQAVGSSNWLAILWSQIGGTLSVLAYTADASAQMNLNYPIAQPVEAILLIPGLGLAMSRWRDARFVLLSLTFWMSIVLGGALTLGVPNVPRIVGILPVMAIVIAVVISRIASLLSIVLAPISNRSWTKRVALALTATVVALSGAQNWHAYGLNYLNIHQFQIMTLLAQYVQHRGDGYYYYNFGGYNGATPSQYWAQGVNEALNYDTAGTDVHAVAKDLPVVNNGLNGDQPALFLVWTPSPYYSKLRRVLRAYYPVQQSQTVTMDLNSGQKPLLVGVTVSAREIDHFRAVRVCYTKDSGSSACRREIHLGVARDAPLPGGVSYPTAVTWSGSLVVPVDGAYQFRVEGTKLINFELDGKRVLLGQAATVQLSHGPHALLLHAPVRGPANSLSLWWKLPGGQFTPIVRRYLWDGHIPSQIAQIPGS